MSSTTNTNVHYQHEHPCLELLDQIEWQTNDIPRLPNNTTTDASTIVAYFPGKASLLLPPLYQTSTGRILTKSDLQPTTATVSSTACNHVAVERCEQALVHAVETHVLPQLVFVALLEEGLAQLVSSTTTPLNHNTMGGGIASSHPFPSGGGGGAPLYYNTSPSSYLSPPTFTNNNTSTTNSHVGGVSPHCITSRIKSGCGLAFVYHAQLVNYHAAAQSSEHNDLLSRRSRRLAPPTLPEPPNPLFKGGRVCEFLVQELEMEDSTRKEEDDDETANVAAAAAVDTTTTNEVVMQKDNDEEDNDDDEQHTYKPDPPSDEEEPEEEEEDDEFDPQDEHVDSSSLEEDEEVTSSLVAKKRSNRTLRHEASPSSLEESESESDENDFTEEELIYDNPHFAPTLDSILECMGRRQKHVTLAHVQHAILFLLKEKMTFPLVHRLDQLVVQHSHHYKDGMASFDVGSQHDATTTTRYIVLECTSGETLAQLLNMEPSEFSKCKFQWNVKRDQASQQWQQHVLEQQQYGAEQEYKRQRAWAYYRYKGIQTGHAVWPQWKNAVTVWRSSEPEENHDSNVVATGNSENGGTDINTTMTAAAVASMPDNTAIARTTTVAAAPTTSSKDATNTDNTQATSTDEELAQAIMLQEEASSSTMGGRRKSRRGGGDGGAVFYGGQTGMSHKQLVDTIVRMAYTQPFQTMAALTALVAEESSNPMHRIRVALGKLLWKHNQVTRVRVNSVWTDMACWNVLKTQGLLQVPEQLVQAVQENDEVEEAEEVDVAVEEPANDASEQATSGAFLPPVRSLPSKENLKHVKVLTEYIRGLHQTELNLRSLILNHLTTTPIAVVATAADERPDSQEAVDATHFEGEQSSLEWSTTGHALLDQVIFRPSFLLGNEESPECSWYKIKDFVPSVPMPPMDEENMRSDARPRQVEWKEPLAVERRMRFRAYPATEAGEELDQGVILVLTEGQVQAGIVAAKLERKKESHDKNLTAEHPFAIGAGTNITLLLQDATSVTEKHCQVAGYDTVLLENGELEHRILLLPDAVATTESSDSPSSFWAVVNMDENGVLTCRSVGGSTTFKILQSDCDSSSSAYQECEGIIEFMYRQQHSSIFSEPVDPVALQIPTYFTVVKHPMDISTLSANLAKGVYSKIPPGQNVGRTPVARMLNGPFKDDVVRIFDNAMMFNPPDDWIHILAASMKKTVVKKIDQVSREADDRFRAFSPRKRQSVYVDEDSDVDMYEYESDREDEEYGGGGRRASRKRKRIGRREDFSTQAVEAPVSLQKTLSESVGLRGPFSSLPINSEAAGFSLTSEWNCRHRTASAPEEETKEDAEELKRRQEMEELLVLHRQVEEMERAGLRRSSRAHPVAETTNGSEKRTDAPNDFEYFLADPSMLPPIGDEEVDALLHKPANSRSEVESQRENLHEVYFAKLYQQLSKFLQPIDEDYGSYVNASFPPFLGRVIPSMAPDCVEDMTWEIRAPFLIPAIRWVLRGLLRSGHLTEVDTDVLLTNDVYYADDSQQPYDILDMKEMQRRRRGNIPREEESEEEVEMSEYEKLRAERVARNAERLKALGLA